MKNLLFYYTCNISATSGGVQRVVALQFYELSKKGYHIFTVYGKKTDAEDLIPEQYQLPDSNEKSFYTIANITYIHKFIVEKHIDVALNFAAVLSKSSLCLVEACKEARIPVISVLHNTLELPLWNIPIIKTLMKHYFARIIFRKLISTVHRNPFYKGARYIYNHAEATVVLSPCYIKEFKEIVIKKPKNISYIYNPLSLPPATDLNWKDKQQIALFVGRLERQKAIDKLIRIWKNLDKRSWKLFIVGSGSQEHYLKDLANKLNLMDSIVFVGHCSPIPYYKLAKVFCLTSIYEGYPMTLIECQAYGVVPIIYDSFASAHDVIETGKNGIVVPAFKERKYIDALHQLINDDDKLRKMSSMCQIEAERYSVDRIMDKWESIIKKCLFSHERKD